MNRRKILIVLLLLGLILIFYLAFQVNVERKAQEAQQEAQREAKREIRIQISINECINLHYDAIRPLEANYRAVLEGQKIITDFWNFVEDNKLDYKINSDELKRLNNELQRLDDKFESQREYNGLLDYPEDNYPDYSDPYATRYFAVKELNSASIDSHPKHWILDSPLFTKGITDVESALSRHYDEEKIYKQKLRDYLGIQSVENYCKENYSLDYNTNLNK